MDTIEILCIIVLSLIIGFALGYFVAEIHALNEVIREGHEAMQRDEKEWERLMREKGCG